MARESFTLDGLDFNDGTTFELLPPLDPGIAEKKPLWITGAHSDGGLLVEESHFDNAVLTARVRVLPQASMDLALAKIGTLVQKLQECEQHERGLAGTWTPKDSTKTMTYYALLGEVTGLPIDNSGDGLGWFKKAPVLTIKITRRPFLYGSEVGTVLDDFSTDTIGGGSYTYISGSGTLSVSGGQLVPSSTAQKRIYHNVRTYADCQVTFKITSGAAGLGGTGPIAKLTTTTQYLFVYQDAGTLYLFKRDGGAETILRSVASTTSATTDYWLRVRVEGNLVTVEKWTSAPSATGTAAVSFTYELAGGDVAKYGAGVSGYAGISWFPANTTERIDDFVIEPNTFKSSNPIVLGTVYDVEGDVPAEARLITTDSASQSRRHLEWGLEQRHYSAGKPRILDQFGVDTIGSGAWAFDAGSGTIAVSGGQLVPSDTTEKRMYRTDGTYGNVRVTLKFTTGATPANGLHGAMLKRLDANNALWVDWSANTVRVVKRDGGAASALATQATAALSASTAYWVRGSIEGNTVTGEFFTADPATGATATATVTHTLSTADALKFGAGISGYGGIRAGAAPVDTRYDDFRIDPLSGNTDLFLTSESHLTVSGFGGTQTTRTGAHTDGTVTNHVIRGTLTTSPVAICGTGNLGHVGTYRVKARVYASASGSYVRFAYQDGDGPYHSNPFAAVPFAANWAEVDLGTVAITEKTLGTQKWAGRVEAYGAAVGDTLDIDYIVLIPAAEGYGLARSATPTIAAHAMNGRDEFTSTTSGAALNARVAPAGGTWATSGAATDLAFADVPTGEETVSRSVLTDVGTQGRLAILGSTNYIDTEVGVRFRFTALGQQEHHLIARYVDANNYLRAMVQPAQKLLNIIARVGGSPTGGTFQVTTPALAVDTWYRLRLVAFSSGVVSAWLLDDNSNVLRHVAGSYSTVATGGTLATGKPGFADFSDGVAATRYYDNFYVATPQAEPVVAYSGQSAEIRHDSAIREDSTGTYWGPIPSYRGSRFLLPPSGDESRTSRVLVKAKRYDVESAVDDYIADSTLVAVTYVPRYLTPR